MKPDTSLALNTSFDQLQEVVTIALELFHFKIDTKTPKRVSLVMCLNLERKT